MFCPRCDRRNDRNPLIVGVKVLAMILFICVVTLVVRAATGVVAPPAGIEHGMLPDQSPAATDQPDVRF